MVGFFVLRQHTAWIRQPFKSPHVHLLIINLHIRPVFNGFTKHTVNFIKDEADKHSNIEGKKWPLTKQK